MSVKLAFKLLSETSKNWRQNFEVKFWGLEVKATQTATATGRSAFLLAKTEICILEISISTSNHSRAALFLVATLPKVGCVVLLKTASIKLLPAFLYLDTPVSRSTDTTASLFIMEMKSCLYLITHRGNIHFYLLLEIWEEHTLHYKKCTNKQFKWAPQLISFNQQCIFTTLVSSFSMTQQSKHKNWVPFA